MDDDILYIKHLTMTTFYYLMAINLILIQVITGKHQKNR
jgi:hypothetical protein